MRLSSDGLHKADGIQGESKTWRLVHTEPRARRWPGEGGKVCRTRPEFEKSGHHREEQSTHQGARHRGSRGGASLLAEPEMDAALRGSIIGHLLDRRGDCVVNRKGELRAFGRDRDMKPEAASLGLFRSFATFVDRFML